ncbi:unnamed protein product [Rotaria sordida]|uniref:Uncharacterized protein n=1 Tax=Rotaria sordida TaxID=392033 RepID=A0A819VKD5_9BILA|nr:unnamed protein product [Rotaria sordida]CAF4110873.1 unnamed protein product [Rotaria sordida]
MAILNNVFTPVTPIIANCNIAILWSHVLNEKDARETNNGTWSPNHFVPLMLSPIRNEFNNINEPTSLAVTPEKKTFKNNAVTQIRMPEFQSSPSRRLRSEENIENDTALPITSSSIQKEKNGKEEKRQIRLEKKRQQSRSNRINETEEQRQIRLEKKREQSRSSRANETEEQRQIRLKQKREQSRSTRANQIEEQRQIRLQKKREQDRSSRINETEEQRQIRLQNKREQDRSSRINETQEQRQIRLQKLKERNKTSRANETEEQRQIRLEQQRKQSQMNRGDKKRTQRTFDDSDIRQESNSIRSPWPEPIPRNLKETCLRQFLQQMSMSVLAEATCTVCNIRTSAKESKKLLVSKIPNIHLLKVSEELKDLIKHLNEGTEISIDDNRIEMAKYIKSPSTYDSPSFYCQNDVILYKDGLFQQNKVDMCTLCQKCYGALSKGHIPKFSAANNMWLGDIPAELQGLTIPEEKLISLYRHNSCIIKLHSPFHSTATAQTALKGNCITFLQNVPNIINSLPLKLDDLCDTFKVIFIGARPPDRIHLKKVLTVCKKKIIQALHWLKKYNVLYQNVNINLENIAQLPEDDIPECIMSTLEQKLDDEEIQSERTGYVPDPLSDPTGHTTADTIPISNRRRILYDMLKGISFCTAINNQFRFRTHMIVILERKKEKD